MKQLSTFLFTIFLGISALADSNLDFTFDLYRKLATQSGNFFLSPLSISTALEMTAAGAQGKTLEQMAKVLHLSKDSQDFYAKLLPQLKSENYKLFLANRLWGQSGEEFKQDFLQKLKANYGADLVPLDFVKQTEESRHTINQWVEENTNSKIKNLLAAGTVGPGTELVLTNAIYFKGQWLEPFDKAQTKPAPFFENGIDKKETSFMNMLKNQSMAENDQAQLIELPYRGADLSFVIILPKEKTGLAALEKNLTAQSFAALYSGKSLKKVRLSLPKFKAESTFELSKDLKQMGMNDAFDPSKANFKGMKDSATAFFISKVAHKTFVDVDEVGTEAAAATAVMDGRAMVRPQTIFDFNADHPFIYMIRHQQSGAILFMGRYTKVPKGD